MDPTKDNPLSVFLSKFILLYIKWPDSSSNGGEIVLEYVTAKKGGEYAGWAINDE